MLDARSIPHLPIILLLLMSPAYPSVAQEQPAKVVVSKGNHAQLEEVIVTAQLREQSLQNVPAAIAALGRTLLEDNEIDNVGDLTKLVPSLQVTESFDPITSDFRVRGIGQDAGAQLNVGLVVDGVPLASATQASFEFSDLERIEVLRGPQGTLFGKNASAGVIHFITREPAKEFEAFVRSTVETQDTFPGGAMKTQAGVSGPLTDTMAGRLTAFYSDVKGHLNDKLQNDHPADTRAWGARGILRWDPTENLWAKLIVEYQDSDGELYPFVYRSVSPARAEREEEDIKFGEDNRDTKTFGDFLLLQSEGLTLSSDWEVGPVILSSITGYRYFFLDRLNTVPGLTGDRIDVWAPNSVESTTLTQEFRLASSEPFKWLGLPGNFEYTFGVLLFEHDRDLRNEDQFANDIPASFAGGAALGIDLQAIPAIPGDSIGAIENKWGVYENTNMGVFGQLEWPFVERWRAIAGARYIYDEVFTDFGTTQVLVHDATGVAAPATATYAAGEFVDEAVIGLLTLQYDWSDHSVLYGRIATGFRGGTIQFEDEDSPAVDPEKSMNTEVGIKSRLFENRLHVNLTVFNAVYEDYQASILRVIPPENGEVPVGVNTESKLDNAGELVTRGVELEFMARPTESLFVNGSIAFNEAEYTEFMAPCFVGQEVGERGGQDVDDDGSCDIQDLSGFGLANSPIWSGSLTTRYTHQLNMFGGSSAFFQITGRYKDEVNYSTTHHPGTVHPAFQTWDLRVGWEGFDNRLSVAGYVNNIFDEAYVTAMFGFSLDNDRRDVAHFIPRAADTQYGLTIAYTL
jgi:iron complex outermembrane receptor protein